MRGQRQVHAASLEVGHIKQCMASDASHRQVLIPGDVMQIHLTMVTCNVLHGYVITLAETQQMMFLMLKIDVQN